MSWKSQGEILWSGKVREFYFPTKSHGKVREFFVKCRLPWKFAVILVDYREYLLQYSPIWTCIMWICKKLSFLLFSIVTLAALKIIHYIIWNELFQTATGICLICVHTIYIYNRLSIKWSGKFLWQSGKSQGTFFQIFGGNTVVLRNIFTKMNKNIYPSHEAFLQNTLFQSIIINMAHDLFCVYVSRQLSSRQRHHYEVIPEGSVCHLYFDLEFSKDHNPQRNGEEMVDIFIKVYD